MNVPRGNPELGNVQRVASLSLRAALAEIAEPRAEWMVRQARFLIVAVQG
jgi:hypothetical protein